ncbi:hypothetical protein PV326_013754 [Microctonus aethiopoides]|nr:hypothetical protein PV326_013754 [Microctonus aethiopoides]
MSKSVELLSGSEDGEPREQGEDRSRLNLNGNRPLSRSATELRANNDDTSSTRAQSAQSTSQHRHSNVQQHHRHVSVAQRTHTFFATLKSRWVRGRSKERKKTKESSANTQDSPYRSGGLESDYAADYSSEHSPSSSATHSPAKIILNRAESPLVRGGKSCLEDSPGRGSDGSSKGSQGYSRGVNRDILLQDDEPTMSTTSGTINILDNTSSQSANGVTGVYTDELTRRRELALRQHAFFQLRLHIRRGANLVAMDRCGASDPYVKIKCCGRLLHKSRTVHRELNPVWDESVTLPIEDPFQPLNIKVFDYDWGLQDDFMGAALLDLTQLDLGHPKDIVLELKDPARLKQHLGEIYLTATLWPRNQQEKEQPLDDVVYVTHWLTIMKRVNGKSSEETVSDEELEIKSTSSSPDKFNTDSNDSGCLIDYNDEIKFDRHEDCYYSEGEFKGKSIKSLSGVNLSRLSRARNLARRNYSSLHDIKQQRKHSMSSLKCCLERRVGSVEKILENKVEKIIEGTVERHSWLQPLETWIIDRRCNKKHGGIPSRTKKNPKQRGSTSDSEIDGGTFERESKVHGISDKVEVILNKNNESPRHFVDSKASIDSSLVKPMENVQPIISSFVSVPDLERHDSKHSCHDFFDKIREGWREKVEDISRRTNRLADVNRRLKSQIWSSVVTIVLVEAKNLLPMDIDGLSTPYVKFRLGTEKYKSKIVNKTLNPVWLEQFDLHLYEDPYLGQELEVTIWDRDKSHQDDLMGRTTIDLAGLERETTHRIWRELEDGSGNVFLLLTISGTTASETISDLAAHEETPQERERILMKYSLWNTLQRPRDVGHLIIKVYRAQGLAAADLGGKSDPFCVLELVNSRLQTQTEYKTLAPNWQKIFTFNVKDINSLLEVTVYDEDRDHKVEFLGKVAIPLLKIKNGEKRWYALKDKKLRGRAKGNFPQILLELTVIWNVLRACARTINPKEKKYMEPEVKFKRQLFLRNVIRLRAIIMYFIDLGKYIQSCWEWESKTRSIVALVLFIVGCYYFEPYMLPMAALLIILKYCIVSLLTNSTGFSPSYQTSSSSQDQDINSDDGPPTPGDDDDDEDDKDKEEKKSLKERLQAIQEVTQTVQNSIGYIASLCERVKNLFNFTVPYLSYLAMVLAILGVIVLYLIPIRYLILAWGVNKFLRKILRPHSVPNNEVLDLISRVPDDEDLLSCRELKPMPTADCERGGTTNIPSGNLSTRREQRKRHKVA